MLNKGWTLDGSPHNCKSILELNFTSDALPDTTPVKG